MNRDRAGNTERSFAPKIDLQAQAELFESEAGASIVANVSKELRTPLNTILILAQILKENAEGNLTAKQVAFATTIHDAGGQVLQWVNEMLALATAQEKSSITESPQTEPKVEAITD